MQYKQEYLVSAVKGFNISENFVFMAGFWKDEYFNLIRRKCIIAIQRFPINPCKINKMVLFNEQNHIAFLEAKFYKSCFSTISHHSHMKISIKYKKGNVFF